MAVAIHRYRFTVGDYHKMTAAGVLSEDDRVELLDGEIVEMAPIGPRHAGTVDRIGRRLTFGLGESVLVRIRNPLRADDHSEPEPDIAVVRLRDDFYVGRHPTPDDVYLLIEVADSSIRLDREVKIPIYARSAVREVWLADIDGGTMHVFRSPAPDGYKLHQLVHRGQTLAPEAFPNLALKVEDLLGP